MEYKLESTIYRCPYCGRDFAVPIGKDFKHTCESTGEHTEEIIERKEVKG